MPWRWTVILLSVHSHFCRPSWVVRLVWKGVLAKKKEEKERGLTDFPREKEWTKSPRGSLQSNQFFKVRGYSAPVGRDKSLLLWSTWHRGTIWLCEGPPQWFLYFDRPNDLQSGSFNLNNCVRMSSENWAHSNQSDCSETEARTKSTQILLKFMTFFFYYCFVRQLWTLAS